MACSGCALLDLFRPGNGGGATLWHIEGAAAPGQPAFDGATVFFQTRDHGVLALDGTTGNERWRATTDSSRDQSYPSGGCVISGENVACGDHDIVAFRRSDGAPAWRYHPTVGYSPGAYEFVAHDGTIFTGSPSGTMYAIDGATGAQRWVVSTLASASYLVSITYLAVDSDIVVGAYRKYLNPLRGGVIAVEARTGRVRWNTEFPRPAADSQTGGEGVALWKKIVFGSSTDGRIYALDRATGVPLWSFRGVGSHVNNQSPWGQDWRALAVAGDRLFAGSNSGWFVAYDPDAQTELWRVSTGDGSMNSFPMVEDGAAVYAIHANGMLAAFSTRDSDILFHVGNMSGQGLLATPALGSDKVFAAAVNGFWAFAKH